MDKLHQKLVARKGLYAFWHEQEHHQLLQWLVLILIAAFITLLLVDRARQPDPSSYGLQGQAARPGSGNPVPPLPLTFLFTHPEAILQPPPYDYLLPDQLSSVGRVIRTIHDFNGKLYFGYGDWGANTGPIVIRSYDPATGTSAAEYTMRTEQIARFVTVGSRLYATSIDPRDNNNPDVYAYRELGSSTWTSGKNTTAIFGHIFDIASLNSQEIWLFGAAYWTDDAIAIHSPDGGATWDPLGAATNLNIPSNGIMPGFNRLHFGGVYNGKLYTQSPYYKNSKIYDPAVGSWMNGPDLLPDASRDDPGYGGRPLQFAGKMVYISVWAGAGFDRFLSFDGSRVIDGLKPIARQFSGVADLQIYNGYLYVFARGNGGYAILRTPDLTKWESVGTVAPLSTNYDDSPSSFRILNNVIYIGYRNSTVYSAPMPTSFMPLN